jgi:hypothetical protein
MAIEAGDPGPDYPIAPSRSPAAWLLEGLARLDYHGATLDPNRASPCHEAIMNIRPFLVII